MLNERVQKLRKRSLDLKPFMSPERAVLLTDFYKNSESDNVSIPVARALSFHYILSNKKVDIEPGELIAGEKGPSPKATPTYPEICIHSLDDLNILDSRPKVSFSVSDDTMTKYKETVIPFWTGRSLRERMFKAVDKKWINSYEAGVFTEFMEQRAPGHTVLDDKIYKKGMKDFIADIEDSIEALDFDTDPEATEKFEELKGMKIAAEALIVYGKRHAVRAEELAGQESDPERKKELMKIAEVCSHVPENAPRTFHEALQYYWFVHLGVTTELNTWDSFNPGRLDQHLYPFYKRELSSGDLTEESARELLQAFWVKFNNQPAPPKVGVTAKESATYTDFCLINVGGVKADGSDAVNDLSYLILDVIEEMRILQPGSMVQISKKNQDRFVKRVTKIVKTGFGQPSIFNTDAIIKELLRQGKSLEDARNGGCSGCVETGAFGKESYILTGYFNLPKILEITLNNGTDPVTGKEIGIKTGDPLTFECFNTLYKAFEKQLEYFIDIKIEGNLVIERLWAEMLPAPFLSILVDDCVSAGKDYNCGGARYNSSYIQGVGTGTISNSLSAIKQHVFDDMTLTMKQLLDAIAVNFSSDPALHQKILNETPHWGNDDDRVDQHAVRVFNSYFNLIDGRPNTKGGHFRVNMLPTTCHVYFGSMIGATPDGRKAGVPLSEGISPVQGTDIHGPTAVLKSAAKIDHIKTGGTLLNQKFTPQILEDESGLNKLVHLIRSYFRMDGHHIQFNVVKAETMREAQKNPEQYRDLIVRVAGYSDYFIDLSLALQEEIIQRTEHKDMA